MEVENLCYKAMAKAEDLKLSKTDFATGRKVLYIAPTQTQARQIIWEALKSRLGKIGKPSEQFLSMKVPNADKTFSTIYVGGWENRENYRGLTDVIHITFDEVDTLKNFFIAWVDIFRPMFLDTRGTANFIGTPKKENPNLKRLEKEFKKSDASFHHFTSEDNPYLSTEELSEIKKDYEGNRESYRQEILAEHIDNTGALFKYIALLDIFTNSVDGGEKYLIVDPADDGSDKTVFSFWEGLSCYRINKYEQLQTNGIINQIREDAKTERIPYSHIAVDAIGVGAGVASSPLLKGIIGFKSSFSAIKTDKDIVRLPNVHYLKDVSLTSEYRNLRSQCVFTLADKVNDHLLAIKTEDEKIKSAIIEELACYQDISAGDGKRMVTQKEDIKEMIGRSPDITDTLIMRMYFEICERMVETTEIDDRIVEKQMSQFERNQFRQHLNSTK